VRLKILDAMTNTQEYVCFCTRKILTHGGIEAKRDSFWVEYVSGHKKIQIYRNTKHALNNN
jgi:hypothetical protein